MHIAMAIPFFHPATRFGGPIAQLELVCRRMAQGGDRVSVVTLDQGIGPEVPRDRWVDVDGYRIWYQSTRPHHRVVPYYCPAVARPLADILGSAEVLHLQMGMTMINAHAAAVANRCGAAVVYSPRGNLNPRRLQVKKWPKAGYLRLFERRVIRAAAACQALTAREVDELVAQGAPAGRIRRIPNCVDVPDSGNESAGLGFRRRFAIPRDAVVVLFLGQLSWVKGLDLLIDAFAIVAQRRRSVYLLIAGPDAGYRRRAVQRARKREIGPQTIFTGHLAGEQKQAALRAADIFALTSFAEGLPNAVLEAAAAGLPLLVTEACNMPEIAHYNAGCVTKADASEIAAALDHLIDAPPRRAAYGQGARRMAEGPFSPQRVVAQLRELYESVRNGQSR